MNNLVVAFFKKYAKIDKDECVFESTGWRRSRDKSELVMCKRRGCRRHAFTKAGPERVHAHCKHPRIGLGNVVRDTIKLFTLGLVKPKEGCNCEARRKLLNVVFGFNVPDAMVWMLEAMGRHRSEPYPWENERVRDGIEIGEPVRDVPVPTGK